MNRAYKFRYANEVAGSFVLLLSTLTVFGTLISDILLAWIDPRIRYQ